MYQGIFTKLVFTKETKKNTMKKITKREVKFFFFGVLAMIVVETVYDWDGFKDSVKRGYHDVAYLNQKK